MTIKELISILRNLQRKAITPDECSSLEMAIHILLRQPDFQKLGRKGGLATKAAHKPDYFRRIGKLGGRRKKQNGNPSQNR
jgi:hypothetical protein